MGSKKTHAVHLTKQLMRQGCDISFAGNGHYRVTYEGTYVGAISGSPASADGLDHSYRKICQRLRLLKKTGRTF